MIEELLINILVILVVCFIIWVIGMIVIDVHFSRKYQKDRKVQAIRLAEIDRLMEEIKYYEMRNYE